MCAGRRVPGKKTRIAACGLADGVNWIYIAENEMQKPNLLLISQKGMSICFEKSSISQQGRTAKGVGGISLANGDRLQFVFQTDMQGSFICFSEEGYVKQSKLEDFSLQNRNGKGIRCFTWHKNGSNGSKILAAFCIREASAFEAHSDLGLTYHLSSSQIPYEPRSSSGLKLIPNVSGEFLESIIQL